MFAPPAVSSISNWAAPFVPLPELGGICHSDDLLQTAKSPACILSGGQGKSIYHGLGQLMSTDHGLDGDMGG